MLSSREDLLTTLEKIKGLPVLVVGDVILDRYIWGKVDRISPEAPVPVVDVKTLEDRLGGAGNVARNLRNIGATVSLCGFVGDDEEAQVVYRLLEQDGISREGIMVDRTRPTCLKTRVIAHSQQVVRIDRESRAGVAHSLREGFAAVVDAQIDQSKALIVSDYGKGAVSPTLMQRFAAASENNRLGLGKRPVVVDPHPANYAIYSCLSVAKPNRKEAEAGAGIKIVDRATALQAGRILCERWDSAMVMITLGEDGLVIVRRGADTGTFLETVAREVFDVSGAGDTVTALFTGAIASGATVEVAGDLANIAAGVVVSEIGTAPISLERLKREIQRLSSQSA
ncbi:MAG: D-glycero-D-mannoheptose-7-phosphate kinase and D-glycero-D-mannoheptose-phosphate [Pseudomonadota bacterium]